MIYDIVLPQLDSIIVRDSISSQTRGRPFQMTNTDSFETVSSNLVRTFFFRREAANSCIFMILHVQPQKEIIEAINEIEPIMTWFE